MCCYYINFFVYIFRVIICTHINKLSQIITATKLPRNKTLHRTASKITSDKETYLEKANNKI